MNTLSFIFIFLCFFNTTNGMDIYTLSKNNIDKLPQDLKNNLFDAQIDQAIAACQPTSSCQKELIRYILTISEIDKKRHAYINSSKFVQKLFGSLEYNIKYPLVRSLLLKSLKHHMHQNLGTCFEKIIDPQTDVGVANYFHLSANVCLSICNMNSASIKEYLQKGADPNFYIDHGPDSFPAYSRYNPPALIQVARQRFKFSENKEKIALLLSYGADVNIAISSENHCPIFSNKTALYFAIERGNEEIISLIRAYEPKNLYIE